MAFIRSSFPTSSTINAWRAGTSNAFTTPRNPAKAATCHTVTAFAHTSAARPNAGSIERDCVMTTRRCLFVRSATIPA